MKLSAKAKVRRCIVWIEIDGYLVCNNSPVRVALLVESRTHSNIAILRIIGIHSNPMLAYSNDIGKVAQPCKCKPKGCISIRACWDLADRLTQVTPSLFVGADWRH